jgi:hypothetical protein
MLLDSILRKLNGARVNAVWLVPLGSRDTFFLFGFSRHGRRMTAVMKGVCRYNNIVSLGKTHYPGLEDLVSWLNGDYIVSIGIEHASHDHT